jgi:hypothetical protein
VEGGGVAARGGSHAGEARGRAGRGRQLGEHWRIGGPSLGGGVWGGAGARGAPAWDDRSFPGEPHSSLA